MACAVYGAALAGSGPLGSGGGQALGEVAWPQQLAAEVRRLYYVVVRERGYVEGGSGPAGSVVRIGVKTPEAPPGCRYVFAVARRGGAEVVVARLIAAACYAVPGVPRHEIRLCCGRA